jgi:hypothetical protein
MPDIRHPRCDHPTCGARMQRGYKRVNSRCAGMCTDCERFRKDNQLLHSPALIRSSKKNANMSLIFFISDFLSEFYKMVRIPTGPRVRVLSALSMENTPSRIQVFSQGEIRAFLFSFWTIRIVLSKF